MLLFTFARSESPLALAFTGENAFNADKQMQVKDVKVVSGAVLVRAYQHEFNRFSRTRPLVNQRTYENEYRHASMSA